MLQDFRKQTLRPQKLVDQTLFYNLDQIYLEMQGNGLSLNSNAAVLLYIKSQPVYKPRINKRFLEQYRHIWL